MSEFTPRYPQDDGEIEASITFSKDEFYDLVYAAREAEIRFKRLRTKTYAEKDTMDAETYDYRVEECNESIAHFKSMEKWLKDKYREAFGEYW